MKALVLIALLLISHLVSGQKYRSTASQISFFSDAPMEDIEAYNKDGKSAIDMDNGEIVFSVPIKSFDFEKSLMQEHFNENYMESDKYPVATFKGKINGFSTKNTAWQTARATGILSMHGIENNMTCDGKIKITPDSVSIEATFQVTISDYKIKIPKVVFYNIAEVVEVKVKFGYAKLD